MLTVIYLILIALMVVADRIIKSAVVANLTLNGEPVQFIKGFLQWRYILNDGASWGMLGGHTVLLVTVTVILIAALLFNLFRNKNMHITGRAAIVLIVAGGIGNMIDRVFNGGRVVDYIDITQLFEFPIFNLADCFVTVGGALLIIFILFFSDKKEADNVS